MVVGLKNVVLVVVDVEGSVSIGFAVTTDIELESSGVEVLDSVGGEDLLDLKSIFHIVGGGSIGVGGLDHSDSPGSEVLGDNHLSALVDLVSEGLQLLENVLEEDGENSDNSVTIQ